jgi:hypothetical protein
MAKGVGKTAFAGPFHQQRGLTKGYWYGELGTLEGKLHHFEITPRDTPWDPNNPDLRGFNFESPTEEALLKNLPEALERFLSSLGFVVHGPVLINRDHYADILNLWPAMCC